MICPPEGKNRPGLGKKCFDAHRRAERRRSYWPEPGVNRDWLKFCLILPRSGGVGRHESGQVGKVGKVEMGGLNSFDYSRAWQSYPPPINGLCLNEAHGFLPEAHYYRDRLVNLPFEVL